MLFALGDVVRTGHGDAEDRLLPTLLSALDSPRMVSIICRADHTTAYSESEVRVYSWEWWHHTIAVSSTGRLYTYGWSKYGQLGHGDFEDHPVPHWLEALQDIYISKVGGDTMALTSDGRLYGWGWSKFGQVGVGDDVDHCSPVQVRSPDDEKIVQVSCGWRHTIPITERRNAFYWGRGTSGQLSHGDTLDRNTPKIIVVLSINGSSLQSDTILKIRVLKRVWISPSERYTIIPDEIVGRGNGSDANVPENNVKQIRPV